MTPASHISRRLLLRMGGLSALPPWCSLGTPALGAPALVTQERRTLFLFVDWFHVKKGQLKATLDPARITPEGRKLIEMYGRDFNVPFEKSGDGFRRDDLATGVRLTPEIAQTSEPWRLKDKPWEEGVHINTLIQEGDRYRCWYYAEIPKQETKVTMSGGRGMELNGSVLAYAESRNGWTWEKPSVKILSFGGSLDNNLLTRKFSAGVVFRDDHGSPEERYKGFHFDALPKESLVGKPESASRYGIYGASSPDGYHWRVHPQPLIREFSDTMNTATWDAQLGCYVGYFRGHGNGRTITRSETKDFWNWPEPVTFLSPNPLDGPADDYYYNGYTVYPGDPSLRLMFVSFYHRDQDGVDVHLALSRDGREYQWLSRHAIVPRGPAGRWDAGSAYANSNLVQLPDGQLALGLNCHSHTHNDYWHRLVYGASRNDITPAWALWKDGRLAGIEASNYGEFTTNSAPFSDTQIELNARTGPAGAVLCELREHGKVLPGFSFAESDPFNGDTVWNRCLWKGKSDLIALRSKRLEVSFRLTNAKVFAYRYV